MPKQDGAAVTWTVGFVSPATKVLIVSGSEDAETIRSGLRVGAAGFLPKSAAGDLLTTIRVVAKGGNIPPSFGGGEPSSHSLAARRDSFLVE